MNPKLMQQDHSHQIVELSDPMQNMLPRIPLEKSTFGADVKLR